MLSDGINRPFLSTREGWKTDLLWEADLQHEVAGRKDPGYCLEAAHPAAKCWSTCIQIWYEQTADKGLYPQNDAAQDNEMTRRVTSLYALHWWLLCFFVEATLIELKSGPKLSWWICGLMPPLLRRRSANKSVLCDFQLRKQKYYLPALSAHMHSGQEETTTGCFRLKPLPLL